jgi:hypothetical protein
MLPASRRVGEPGEDRASRITRCILVVGSVAATLSQTQSPAASVMIWAQAVASAGRPDGTVVAEALQSGAVHVFGIEARFNHQGNMQGPLGKPALWVWRQRRPVPLQPDAPGGAKSSSGPRDVPGRIN